MIWNPYCWGHLKNRRMNYKNKINYSIDIVKDLYNKSKYNQMIWQESEKNGQNLRPSEYKRMAFTHYINLFEDGYLFSDICLKYFFLSDRRILLEIR